MENAVFYSWLGASASAPLVMVLSLWTIFVFHTYRSRWRTVDLFLVAVAAQEFIIALFAFGFSMISLISPRKETPCGFVLWGFTTTSVFQLCTLTSLVVDRALTVRWPYRYRFSVRRNQIRYHIAVMSVIAVFVGVAGVFARHPPFGGVLATSANACSLNPLRWDIRFSIFLLGLDIILLLTWFMCFVNIEIHKCRSRGLCSADQNSGQLSVTPVSSREDSNGSMTSSSGSSGRPLQGCPGRQESRRPYAPDRRPLEFRWTVVATVSTLCCVVNHLPYGVLSIVSLSSSKFSWMQWHVDNMIVWMRLTEGFLVPVALYFCDSVHRGAVRKCFQRRRGSLSGFAGADDRRFRLFFEEASEKSQLSSPFYTLNPPLPVVTNYKRTSSSRKGSSKRKPATPQQRSRNIWSPMNNQYMLPTFYGIDTILEKSPPPSSTSDAAEKKMEDADTKESKLLQNYAEDDSNKFPLNENEWQDGDSHIYATLSDTLSNYSFQSTLIDDSAIGLNNFDPDDDTYDGSFTTLANDDFEFHDTRPCGGEVKMRPSIPPQVFNHTYDVLPMVSLPSRKENQSKPIYCDVFKEKRSSIGSTASTSSVKDLVLHIDNRTTAGIDNPSFEEDPQESASDSSKDLPLHVYRVEADILRHSKGLQGSRPTSLSMNDLELIGTDPAKDSLAYVMPKKSESMMSLTNFDDESPPPSRHLPVVKECNENEQDGVASSKIDSNHQQWRQRNSSPDIWRDSYLKKARRKLRSKKWRSNQDVTSKRLAEFQLELNDQAQSSANRWRLCVGSNDATSNREHLHPLGMQRQFFSDLHLPATPCKYKQPCRDPDCCKLIISEVL